MAVGVCQEVSEGIIQGLKEQNVARTRTTAVSINGGPMDVENFKKGDLGLRREPFPPLHGMICAENLISYLKGKPYQTATYSPITWVSAKTWQKDLIPWGMDASWLPVVKEFVRSGASKLSCVGSPERQTEGAGQKEGPASPGTGEHEGGARKVWLAVRTPPHLVRRAMGPIPSDIFLELFARVPARVVDPLIGRLNRLLFGDLSVYGFGRPPLGLKATVEQRGRIPTLADELVDAVRAGRAKVVAAVSAIKSGRVILGDGTAVRPEVIVAATGFGPTFTVWPPRRFPIAIYSPSNLKATNLGTVKSKL